MDPSLIVSVALATVPSVLNLLTKVDWSRLTKVDWSNLPSVGGIKPSGPSAEEIDQNLASSLRQEQLVLILGAGVSKHYKLPCWADLIQGLRLRTLQTQETLPAEQAVAQASLFNLVFPQSSLIAVRQLKNAFPIKDEHGKSVSFVQAVRDILYEPLDTQLGHSETMKEIRELCVAPGRSPNLNSIITYNFDDLLEHCLTELEEHGIHIPFKSIFDVGMRARPGQLPIYHVHGYLPRDGDGSSEPRIVFSEDLYHAQYVDLYNWSNLAQIEKFRENTCLFIGLSMTDPNQRRLLDIAKEQRGGDEVVHFVVKRRHSTEEIVQALTKALSQHPEVAKSVKDSGADETSIARSLVSYVERLEEEDARSFGAAVRWVDRHEEAAAVLRNIREGNLVRTATRKPKGK